jgi:DNA-binding response OmpR family regulator
MARWRILTIDDDPDILELIEMTLKENYDILALDSGVHAIEMVDTFEPDLIILDIMMPKVTGYHLMEVLRERKDTAKLPIVFLSAKDTIRDQKYGPRRT